MRSADMDTRFALKQYQNSVRRPSRTRHELRAQHECESRIAKKGNELWRNYKLD